MEREAFRWTVMQTSGRCSRQGVYNWKDSGRDAGKLKLQNDACSTVTFCQAKDSFLRLSYHGINAFGYVNEKHQKAADQLNMSEKGRE